jgi:hypothetical protein
MGLHGVGNDGRATNLVWDGMRGGRRRALGPRVPGAGAGARFRTIPSRSKPLHRIRPDRNCPALAALVERPCAPAPGRLDHAHLARPARQHALLRPAGERSAVGWDCHDLAGDRLHPGSRHGRGKPGGGFSPPCRAGSVPAAGGSSGDLLLAAAAATCIGWQALAGSAPSARSSRGRPLP